MSAYPNLFSPVQVGPLTLANRIVHASTSTHYADKGRVTDRLISYYANRARGGASLLVSEPMGMLHWQTLPTRPHILSGVNADTLPRWAEAVRQEGGHMLGQIQDNGRGFRAGFRNLDAHGASALPDDLSWTVPHALETDAVVRMIDEFVRSSALLAEAGFSGVEISAGHGHLFHQFLSRRSNRREDGYGGNLTGRTRLLRELMAGIRAECGAGFLIGLKLPAEDGMPDGIDQSEAAEITQILHATGQMDYLTYCWGSHSDTLYTHLPDNHGPRMPYVDTIERLGRAGAPGVPLGALGLITDPNEGERLIRDGKADLVMLARPLVTDPAWGIKARDGREAEIRYCVSCNSCWSMIASGRGLLCDNNPRVGAADEADWKPPLADAKKRVVVVGAGIAGMEAAWVAAARGHEVHVFGASDEVGGKARIHADLPGGEGLSSIYDYQALAAARHGVTLHMGQRASAGDILALEPDHVVLATGSTPAWPDFLPPEWREEGLVPDIREAAVLLRPYETRMEGTAVIWDMDHGAFTYDAAEFLMTRFEAVTILTPRERIASDESLMVRQGVYKRLYSQGVRIVTSVRPLPAPRIEDGEIAYANVFSGAEATLTGVAFLTYATPRIPDDALAAPLRAAGIDVRLIGDCKAPRITLSATSEGCRAAMDL
ncbi:oxidoreductase [Stakelama tenebrarum]|uniref:FAD-dependent oxidoreductase n=1 Tax=Stakelama tenebrarum TaxID=2711215 RepID=A0A6G6Y1N9_9SPHN|nr:FAD-dependent oxidoreductase [Sphingosinithalassobacter tenebrarum]QIG78854.1 FAD-dependent oxidoreductase [Sphingosinithalassobacter tenebrarum]